ncbi:MAG TPA: hypothetical protein VEJ18_22240 [Planctomycetota bacterium]|nr:hypothetical protein [Planctomycetota bacterium]
MLKTLQARLRKMDMDKVAARAGAFLSRHRGAGRALLFAAGFAFIVLLVHREVYSFLTRRSVYAVPELKTAVGPSWADRHGVELVKIDGPSTNLFDPDLVARVGAAFESSAWIKKVTAVERVFPDQLRVRFEYRQPHVAVKRDNGYVLVDAEGVRLPGVYVDPPTCERRTVVAGLASAPPAPGRRWEEPALRAAIEMADFVQQTPLLARLNVREINVANFAGRLDPRQSEITLVTRNGCELAWGRGAAQARYGDLTPEEKLENLREVLAAYPDLQGLRRAKIYFRGRTVEPVDSHAQR